MGRPLVHSLPLVLAALSACGETTVPSGDDGGGDEPGVSVPDRLNFGAVPVFARVQESIPITKRNNQPQRLLRFEQVTSFEGDGYRFALETTLRDLPLPAQPLQVDFSFEAQRVIDRAVSARGRFVFESGQVSEITLIARAGEALEVEPEELDFGAVITGRNRQETITIRNLLDRPVPVYAQVDAGRTAVEPVQGVARFDVDAAVEDSGILASANPLGPGESLDVPIFYTADAATPDRDVGTWRVGACPSLDDCGVTVTFRGEPLRAPIICEGEGVVDGAIDVGLLNPPDNFETVLTCTAQTPIRLDSVIPPGLDSGFSIFADTRTPRTFGEGDSFEIELEFEPTDLPPGADAEDADLELRVADVMTMTELAPVVIPLSGGHGFPVVRVEPATLDFQSVRIGSEKSLRVQVYNDGPVPFEGLIELPDGSPFSVDLPLLEVEPASSQGFELRFSPQGSGDFDLTMVLSNRNERIDEAGLDMDFQVPLQGQGVDLPPCSLSLSAGAVDFGRIIRGQEARSVLVLENAGAADCIVNGIELEPTTDPEFFIVSPDDPATQFRLAPGEAAEIEIGVSSDRDAGVDGVTLSGSFRAYTSTDVGTRSFDLRANQRRLPVVTSPNFADFRNGTDQCPSYELPVRLLNGSDAAITVTAADIVGVDADHFTLQPTGAPFDVDSFDAAIFDVAYLPSAADPGLPSSAELRITLGDAATEPLIIPLLGLAADQEVIETITQIEPAAAVAFAVPLYQSFAGQDVEALQLAWGSAFDEFYVPFDDENIDHRFGWLTEPTIDPRNPTPPMPDSCDDAFDFDRPADSSNHDGRCGFFANGSVNRHRSNWVAVEPNEMPDVRTAWEAQFAKGASSFEPNPILRSVAASVRPRLRDWNSEVYDEAEYWHFVVTQVRDDESDDIDPTFFADFIRASRGAPYFQSVGASGLLGPESGDCNSGVGLVQATPRARSFVDRLAGGLNYALCDINPSNGGATVVGEEAAGMRRRIRLSRRASTPSIRVFADGVRIERGGLEQNWIYDSNLRTVLFQAQSLLAPGTEIEVRYSPACF